MNVLSLPQVVRGFVQRETKNIAYFDQSWSRRLWLYRNGFTSSRGVIYDISSENVDYFLSDTDWMATKTINQPYDAGLKVKPLFHRLVANTHRELLPTAYGVLQDGRVINAGFSEEINSIDDLCAFVSTRRLVIKPVDGFAGYGIHVLSCKDDRPTFDGEILTEEAFRERLRDCSESMIVEFVNQAEYSATIYPETTNTIRILTMVDPDSRDPFIAAAVHRFGTSDSGTVDNWSSGGATVGVDRETGELGEAVTSPKSGTVARYESHPDTGSPITGEVIPGWDDIRSKILDLASEYSWMWPYVGWDVVVTDDTGAISILEGNMYSDVDLIQAHEPLLADERVRRFYEHHGVI